MSPYPRRHAAERLAVAIAAAAFLYLVTFRDGTFVYLFHKAGTGAWIDEGARVAEGEVPYRDFTDRVAPGIFYLHAAVIRLAGPRLDAIAAAGILMGSALAAMLHALACAMISGRWRLAPPAVFVLLVYPAGDLGNHRWPALLLVLAAVRAAAPHPPPPASAILAGLMCGLAACFTPAIGVAAAAGLVLHLGLERPPGVARTALRFALAAMAAAGAPALALAGYAGAARVADGWWGSAFAFAGGGWPARWTAPTAGYVTLTLSGLAAAVRWAPRRPARGTEEEPALRMAARVGLMVLAAGAASYLDPYTLAAHSTVLLVAAAAAADRVEAPDRRLLWTRRAASAVLVSCAVINAAGLVTWRQKVQPMVRQTFRAGDAWIGAPNAELRWLEGRTRPGDRVFVFPAGGAAYFLTGTRNATPFPYAIEGRFDRKRQREALAHIAAVAPAVGIWMGSQRWPPPAGVDDLDPLYAGILASYRPVVSLPDGTLLLERAAGGSRQ